LVVGLQNGMSIDDIASVLGPQHTVGAVIEMASNMFIPGIVNRENSPETAWFAVGAIDESVAPRVPEVWEVLRHAGTVEISNDIRSSKWMKLTANAGELIPSAILGLPLADAAADPSIREFMDRCCIESAYAAVASGSRLRQVFGLVEADVTTPERYAPRLLDIVLERFSSPTTKTTVLQDWLKGRRAEVQEINGTVVRAMARVGLMAPANQRTVEVALRIEAGELTPSPDNAMLLLADSALVS
jgi:2-dehydropantoate 2-reductase